MRNLIGRRLIGSDGQLRKITEYSDDGAMVCTETVRGRAYRLWIGATFATMRADHYEAEHLLKRRRPKVQIRPDTELLDELLDELLAEVRRKREAS